MPERALEGITVIECGKTGAAAYAAKLMADLGADVIKVEPPQGDPARALGPFPGHQPHAEKSGTFLYLNTNKQGITLDISVRPGPRCARQAARHGGRLRARLHAARGRVARA